MWEQGLGGGQGSSLVLTLVASVAALILLRTAPTLESGDLLW